MEAGEGGAGQGPEHQAAERGADRDHQAVLQILEERDVGQDARVVVEDGLEEPLGRLGIEGELSVLKDAVVIQ